METKQDELRYDISSCGSSEEAKKIKSPHYF